jgi:hypothetical protein
LKLLSILLIVLMACREEYQPEVTTRNNNFLVVDGIINPDSTTIILSRTRILNDTTSFIPEPNAVVYIEGERGSLYPVRPKANGVYTSSSLPLDLSDRYRVKISVSSKEYASEFVSFKRTPPIDSITWKHGTDVNIYINTHDPTNKTRYYRWEFEETWEFHSYYDTNLGFANGQLYFRNPSQLLNVCYSTESSTDILLGTSSQLDQDRIENAPITTIPDGSQKLYVKYSVLVRQYALSKEAYDFWQLLRRNSSQVGGLFDAQPSELLGNIHCISNPAEPVIGFVSASTVETKRIFIDRTQLDSWTTSRYDFICAPRITTQDSAQYYLQDTSMAPAYSISGGGLAIAKNICVDCTRHGGVTTRPAFWR